MYMVIQIFDIFPPLHSKAGRQQTIGRVVFAKITISTVIQNKQAQGRNTINGTVRPLQITIEANHFDK
jgi:hypothetical protein